MRDLLNNNGKLVTLMGSLFAGIIAVTGAVALFLGDMEYPPLFAASSTSQSTPAPQEPEGPGEDATPPPAEDPDNSGFIDPPADPDGEEPVIYTYNKPDEMRGLYLIPGQDFLTGDSSEEKVKAEIDAAIGHAVSMKLNTVILQTAGQQGVIYNSKNLPALTTFFDPLTYAISQARAQGLYVYCIYNTMYVGDGESMGRATGMDAATLDFIREEVGEFVRNYHPDGLFLDQYYNEETTSSYGAYLSQGGGIGYQSYMRSLSRTALETVLSTVEENAPGMQVGILTDAVWENKSQNEAGSNTSASWTVLANGNTDVKGMLEEGKFDFVGVRASGSTSDGAIPFDTVTAWWGKLAQSCGTSMYVIHSADRMGTNHTGWSSNTEMVRQLDNATGWRATAAASLTPWRRCWPIRGAPPITSSNT